jgi:hypothetical protein
MITDLDNVDLKGRVDVLAYRGIELIVKRFEKEKGLSGIWDNLKPHVNNIVNRHVTGIEIPSELKVLLGIMQANWPKKVE